MCTVTFIPSDQRVFVTHNRDEKNLRPAAIPPKQYNVNGNRLLFPKDKKAGGSWIGLNENGNTAVLFNGAFSKHVPLPFYKRSRGLVFLDIAASNDMLQAWKAADLREIEPFTLILWNNSVLHESRWDGSRKYTRSLDAGQTHIWSSVTLYETEALDKRKLWFEEWKQEHPIPTLNDIIGFHLRGGEGDAHNDLCMERDGCMRTVSITAMEITAQRGLMKYFDLQDDSSYEQEIKFIKDPVENE